MALDLENDRVIAKRAQRRIKRTQRRIKHDKEGETEGKRLALKCIKDLPYVGFMFDKEDFQILDKLGISKFAPIDYTTDVKAVFLERCDALGKEKEVKIFETSEYEIAYNSGVKRGKDIIWQESYMNERKRQFLNSSSELPTEKMIEFCAEFVDLLEKYDLAMEGRTISECGEKREEIILQDTSGTSFSQPPFVLTKEASTFNIDDLDDLLCSQSSHEHLKAKGYT